MANLKLIVGLGNPGQEYANTRHNVGAWWVSEICKEHNANLREDKKFNSLVAKVMINGNSLHCLIPTTYMNLSGKAIASIVNYYNIESKEMLIVHDDLDLPPGEVKLKAGGGHQGHNGLRDIISALGDNDFNRLRIGIGHPGDKNKVASFVLRAPGKDEKQLIDSAMERSLYAVSDIIEGKFQQVMNNLHSSNK